MRSSSPAIPKSGKWLGPVFYTMATASVGFQAGISVSENVTLVMTDKGFNSLLATSFKMGGDASIAAGPVGAGAKSDIVADLITFSRAKGVYGGVNLDGTVVTSSDDWNQAYYGKKVLAARRPRPRRRQQQGRRRTSRRNDGRREEVTIAKLQFDQGPAWGPCRFHSRIPAVVWPRKTGSRRSPFLLPANVSRPGKVTAATRGTKAARRRMSRRRSARSRRSSAT